MIGVHDPALSISLFRPMKEENYSKKRWALAQEPEATAEPTKSQFLVDKKEPA